MNHNVRTLPPLFLIFFQLKLVSDLNSQIDDFLKKSRFFTEYEKILEPQTNIENPNKQESSLEKIEDQIDLPKPKETIIDKQTETDQKEIKILEYSENEEGHLSLLELDKLLTDRLIQLNPDNKFIFEIRDNSHDKQDHSDFRTLPHLNTIVEENSVITSEMDTIPKTNNQSVSVADPESSESFHNTYSNICDKDKHENNMDYPEKISTQSDLIRKKKHDRSIFRQPHRSR